MNCHIVPPLLCPCSHFHFPFCSLCLSLGLTLSQAGQSKEADTLREQQGRLMVQRVIISSIGSCVSGVHWNKGCNHMLNTWLHVMVKSEKTEKNGLHFFVWKLVFLFTHLLTFFWISAELSCPGLPWEHDLGVLTLTEIREENTHTRH